MKLLTIESDTEMKCLADANNGCQIKFLSKLGQNQITYSKIHQWKWRKKTIIIGHPAPTQASAARRPGDGVTARLYSKLHHLCGKLGLLAPPGGKDAPNCICSQMLHWLDSKTSPVLLKDFLFAK
jgi:hypothetical protein